MNRKRMSVGGFLVLGTIFACGLGIFLVTRTSVIRPVVEGINQRNMQIILGTPEGAVTAWLEMIRTSDDVAAFRLMEMDDMSKGLVQTIVIGWRARFGYRTTTIDGPITQTGATYRAPIMFTGDHSRDAGVERCHTLPLAQQRPVSDRPGRRADVPKCDANTVNPCTT